MLPFAYFSCKRKLINFTIQSHIFTNYYTNTIVSAIRTLLKWPTPNPIVTVQVWKSGWKSFNSWSLQDTSAVLFIHLFWYSCNLHSRITIKLAMLHSFQCSHFGALLAGSTSIMCWCLEEVSSAHRTFPFHYAMGSILSYFL